MLALLRSSSPALAAAAAALLIAGAARAGGPVLPSGLNLETLPGGSFVSTVLPDGTVLANTGSFGNDDLLRYEPDGSLTHFANLGSLAGIAQSPVTGDIVVGDSHFLSTGLFVLRDLNHDGDALDDGEHVPHAVPLPELSDRQQPLPFDLAFRPGTDELFVSGSTFGGLGAVVRIADGAAGVYADGLGFAACMVWNGDTLYVADTNGSGGRVLALTDGNGDDDALDAGESEEFASGLSGASDLVQAQDGHFYLTGFNVGVARLAPDGNDDGVSDLVETNYIGGLGFTANLTLIEGSGGFVPGAAGHGLLIVQDFDAFTDRVARPAPHAALSLDGVVANNETFTLHLEGEPGSLALAVFALDEAGVTLPGIGDLHFGFTQPWLLAPLGTIGGGGEATLTITLHGVDGAVGLPFTLQGFAVRGGDVGIGNALELEVQP